jgi:hypothetical protein
MFNIDTDEACLQLRFEQLRRYVQHTCSYGATHSPEDDFCHCQKTTALNNFIDAMTNHFRELREELNRLREIEARMKGLEK